MPLCSFSRSWWENVFPVWFSAAATILSNCNMTNNCIFCVQLPAHNNKVKAVFIDVISAQIKQKWLIPYWIETTLRLCLMCFLNLTVSKKRYCNVVNWKNKELKLKRWEMVADNSAIQCEPRFQFFFRLFITQFSPDSREDFYDIQNSDILLHYISITLPFYYIKFLLHYISIT